MSANPSKVTAVGLCPEATWGIAPVTLLSGSTYGIGIPYTNPHRFMIVEPGDGIKGNPTITQPTNEMDGSIEPGRLILEEKVYRGKYSFKADSENLYLPMLAMLGQEVGVVGMSSQANTAGIYSHYLTPYKSALSLTIEEIFGLGAYGRVTTGCIPESLDLTFSKGNIMAALGVYGRHQVRNTYWDANNNNIDYIFDNTGDTDANHVIPGNTAYPVMQNDGTTRYWGCTATPVYVDIAQQTATPGQAGNPLRPLGPGGNGPGVFAGMGFGTKAAFASNSAFLCIDGQYIGASAQSLLEGLTVNIARGLDTALVAGSQFDIGACASKAVVVKGTLPILYQDDTIGQAALRASTVALNFKVLLSPVGVGGLARAIEVYIPNLKFTDPGPTMPDGMMKTGGAFEARRDPTLGYAIQVILTNTVVTGQIAAGTGGIGGGRIVTALSAPN